MMEGKRISSRRPMMVVVVVVYLLLATLFRISFSETNHSAITNRKTSDSTSIVFPLHGSVYPTRGYFPTINIGHPAKPFELHIDPGSDLSWVRCDEPCADCIQPVGNIYKPRKDNIVECRDPLCVAVQGDERICENPTDRCEYVIFYGDDSSTEGYLVRDIFHLRDIDGSVITSPLVFGCGYKQLGEFKGDGILGLSKGPVGFLSQMHSQELIEQVVGHCFRGEGGGFLFLGDDFIPTGLSWTPIIDNSDEDYLSGPADLLFDGSPTQVRDLVLDFDAGTALFYLKHQVYPHILNLIVQALRGTPLIDAQSENELSICWRHERKSITFFNDITDYFKNITLRFRDVELDLPPQAYLVLTQGKVCLGILDGDTVRLNNHLIGAIAMQDKLVIYNTVTAKIGWASHNCNLPT